MTARLRLSQGALRQERRIEEHGGVIEEHPQPEPAEAITLGELAVPAPDAPIVGHIGLRDDPEPFAPPPWVITINPKPDQPVGGIGPTRIFGADGSESDPAA